MTQFYWGPMKLIVILVGLLVGTATFAETEFGVMEHSETYSCQKQALRIGVRHCGVYYLIGKSTSIKYSEFPENFSVTIVLKFPKEHTSVHKKILSGFYDKDLALLASHIVAARREVTLRVMPEGNTSWHSDSAYTAGQSPESYLDAYKYVVSYLRDRAGPMISGIELNLSASTLGIKKNPQDAGDFSDFNPGSRYVDLVSYSVYNYCESNGRRTSSKDFSSLFRGAYQASKKNFPGIKIGVGDVATSPSCSIKFLDWYTNLLVSLATEFKDVKRVFFLFRDQANPEAPSPETPQWDDLLWKHQETWRALISLATKRPTGQSAAAKSKSASSADLMKGWRFPWSASSSVAQEFDDDNYPGTSPLTGGPFGRAGLVNMTQFRQSLFWAPSKYFMIGPSFWAQYANSSNDLMWWNNRFSLATNLGVTYNIYSGAAKKIGSLVVEMNAEKKFYTVEVSDSVATDPRNVKFGAKAQLSFNGDWLQ